MKTSLRAILATIAILSCILSIASSRNILTAKSRIEFISFHNDHPLLTFSRVRYTTKKGILPFGEFRRDIETISFEKDRFDRLFHDAYSMNGLDCGGPNTSDEMSSAHYIVDFGCRSADFNPRTGQLVSWDVHNNIWIVTYLPENGADSSFSFKLDENDYWLGCRATSRDDVFAFYNHKRVIIYDIATKNILGDYSIKLYVIRSGITTGAVDVSPTSTRMAFTTNKGMFVQELDSPSATKIAEGSGNVCFSDTGDLFFTVHGEGIRVLPDQCDHPFDLVTSTEPFSLVSASQGKVISAAGNKVLIFDRTPQNQKLPELEVVVEDYPSVTPDCIAISNDSSMIAVGTDSGEVQVYAVDGRLLWSDSGWRFDESIWAVLIPVCIALIAGTIGIISLIRTRRSSRIKKKNE